MTSELPEDSSVMKFLEKRTTPPREIDSQELLQGDSIVVIRHGESVYYLCQTRNGKLIMRK